MELGLYSFDLADEVPNIFESIPEVPNTGILSHTNTPSLSDVCLSSDGPQKSLETLSDDSQPQTTLDNDQISPISSVNVEGDFYNCVNYVYLFILYVHRMLIPTAICTLYNEIYSTCTSTCMV